MNRWRMISRFRMKCNDISARFSKAFNKRINRRNHQMHIKNFFRNFANRFNDNGANREIRHKVPVHDINMNIVSPRRVDRPDFIPKLRKIC